MQISRRRPEFTLPPMHKGLRLSSHDALREASGEGGRVFCDACQASRRFYCHVCLTSFTAAPRVALPCRVYFITDHRELLSKATGVHCALLAPDHVVLCRPNEVPPLDLESAVLLFPAEGALSVADYVETVVKGSGRSGGEGKTSEDVELGDPVGTNGASTPSTPSAVVIIDSKWNGAHLIASTPNLRDLPRVKLSKYRTAFWRFHPQPRSQEKRDIRDRLLAEGKDTGDDKVCSAEALFFFLRELHEALGVHAGEASGDNKEEARRRGERDEGSGNGPEMEAERGEGKDTAEGVLVDAGPQHGDCHCFDDLLWYFAWQHQTITGSAAVREYHPIPPQLKKSARRALERTARDRAKENGQQTVDDEAFVGSGSGS